MSGSNSEDGLVVDVEIAACHRWIFGVTTVSAVSHIEALVQIFSAVTAVFIAILGGAVSLLASRNDRVLANHEADLLQKLDADSPAGRQLRDVIEARVHKWYRRAYTSSITKDGRPYAKRRRVAPWLRLALIVGSLMLLMLGPLAIEVLIGLAYFIRDL